MTNTSPAAVVMTPLRVRMTLLGVMFGLLLSMLDNFIVGTAAPSIVRDLGDASLLSWVVTAYALTTAVTTPIWGKLGDLFGRKRIFQISVAAFIVGSLLAALAPSMILLILARAIQGIGAGGLAVGAFAVIGDLVPPRERGKYQGMVAIIVATGTIGGPLVGGFLTDAFGWRSAFLINLPLGVLTMAWVAWTLRMPRVQRKAQIDWLGAVLLGIAVSALIFLTSWAGDTFEWASWQTGAFVVVFALALVAFVWWEQRVAEPLLPLAIFRERSFTMASILAFTSGIVVFASVLYLPIFQQTVQGASASSSGLLLLPMMIPVVIVSQIAGRLMTRTGRYKVFPVLGSIALTVGGVLLATMTVGTPIGATAAFMIPMGIGSGLTQQMTTTIAQNSVQQKDMGAASGAVTLLRTIGGSLGIAIFGSIFTAYTVDSSTGSEGIAQAISTIFGVTAAISALGVAAAFAIKEIPLRRGPAAGASEPRSSSPTGTNLPPRVEA
ncbi:MDR family MFS transporter [Microbacterium sp. MPKO10]|uniref:MDR family MFS transporter n=1 Tax=Microbacterium sp. MPKO10 TaxID=2989818 RepID=UPI0022360D68|nr:MDR family MFS transporter [Microbacterium sp. MPKO10]MCW4457701.1 MFS transporter [Microbacterium sp. MPKO10]